MTDLPGALSKESALTRTTLIGSQTAASCSGSGLSILSYPCQLSWVRHRSIAVLVPRLRLSTSRTVDGAMPLSSLAGPAYRSARRFTIRTLEKAAPRFLLSYRARRHLAIGEPELRLLPMLSRSACVSIDVGANHGVYSYWMARYAKSVLSFEPNPRLARLLRQSLPDNCHVLEYALSDFSECADLVVPIENGELVEGHSYLASKQDRHHATVYSVRTRRLDECVHEPVGLIKVDVEGHELRVLMGASTILDTYGPNIIVEAEERHRRDAVSTVQTWLTAFGYRGFFFKDGACFGIDEFNVGTFQRTEHLQSASVPRQQYINNFVFTRDPNIIGQLRSGNAIHGSHHSP